MISLKLHGLNCFSFPAVPRVESCQEFAQLPLSLGADTALMGELTAAPTL